MTWAQTCDPTRPLPPDPWLPVFHVHGAAPCNGPVAEIKGWKLPGEMILMSEIRRIDGNWFFPGEHLRCLGCGQGIVPASLGYV